VLAAAGIAGASLDVRADEEITLGSVPVDEEIPLGSPPAPEARPEIERWVPSFSIFGGFVGQRAVGELMTSEILGPSLPNPKQPLNAPSSGSDTMVSATVGASIEVMTPRFYEKFGKPRAFVHVDGAGAFGFRRTIAGNRKPGDMNFDPGEAPTPGEEVVTGQGTRIFAEVDPFLFSAGIGVAFTADIWDRTVRFKPSFEYMREEVTVTGIANRAVQLEFPGTSSDSYRFVEFSDEETRVFNGIGPGFEVEGDVARAGPFMLSVYADALGYYFVGDREVNLSDSNEYGEYAEWKFEKQEWGWGGRVGLRFRWLPE
jgi:hypothetical protein